MAQLDLAVEKPGPGIGVIRPRGLIDIVTSPELDQALESLFESGCFRVVVDMASTSYISSAGWGIFIGSLRTIRERGGDLVFAGMRPEIRDFFVTLDLPSTFQSFGDLDSAVAYLAARPA